MVVNIKHILSTFFFAIAIQISYSQTVLYSEDFEGADNLGKGCNDGCTDPASGNWSTSVIGAPDVSGAGDHCIVISGQYLEWKDNAVSSEDFSDAVEWLSNTVTTSSSNISIDIDYYVYDAFAANKCGLRLQYRIDGGTWTNIIADQIIDGGSTSGTASISSLSATTNIQVRVLGFTNNASGSIATIDNVLISIPDPCSSEIITQATNLTFPTTRTNSIELNWDRGDGDEILVLARENAAISSDPIGADTYTANSSFGSGSTFGGAYVIYKGTGTSVTLTNLQACTDYHFALYEYNTVAGPFNCYETPALTSSTTTTSRIENYPYTQEFSSVSPCEFSSTGSSWDFTYDATSTSNYTSAVYSARLDPASDGNGNYIYIETEVEAGYTYQLSFQAKRFCDITVNTNETADQTSLLSSQAFTGECDGFNFGLITASYDALYSGTMYWQVLAETVYAGPTQIYVDDFTITGTLTALPITLSTFDGLCNEDGIEIKWVTESELNNHYFTIERANSSLIFEEIGRVLCAGNSVNQITYIYLDPSPSLGVNYYRLKQTDFDGVSEVYSPISIINNCKDLNNRAFFKDDKLIITVDNRINEISTLYVYDLQGKLVYSNNALKEYESILGMYEVPLINNIASGIYLVVIQDFAFSNSDTFKVLRN